MLQLPKSHPSLFLCLLPVLLFLPLLSLSATFNQYQKADLLVYREEVREMFQHAYDSYLTHAYPFDELRPLSCDGVDTWGSYSLTLIDALDTLAVMGNYSEFGRVYNLVAQRENFDANINVSVFETNIRIVGGLLSAHLMARRAGVELEPGWPCAGPLLRLAEDAVQRLLPAFDTPTGMPYGTVNLRHGVPVGETPITCTAGVGTFIVEFGALSRLTGNPLYEETAMRALRAIWENLSGIGLPGNHVDVLKGKWTAVEAGIGAGVDSWYEYLVKGASLLQRPELMHMFNRGREAVERYLRKDDWHFWVNMKSGQVTMPLFQSLEAFWPGTLSQTGDLEAGLASLHNYHQIWRQYGFTPEFYNVAQGGASANREGYPLRPELIESIMYMYRATGDPWLIDAGVDILKSIETSARTPCGYATVKNAKTHTLEDRMESFFLAETTKYLYLLFDPDNPIHNPGTHAEVFEMRSRDGGEGGGRCVLEAGGYIFNSEAHPIDPAALACCSGLSEKEVKEQISLHMVDILNPAKVKQYRGDLVPVRIRKITEEREQHRREKKERERQLRLKLEELRLKAIEEAEAKAAEEAEAKAVEEAEAKAAEEIKAEEEGSASAKNVSSGQLETGGERTHQHLETGGERTHQHLETGGERTHQHLETGGERTHQQQKEPVVVVIDPQGSTGKGSVEEIGWSKQQQQQDQSVDDDDVGSATTFTKEQQQEHAEQPGEDQQQGQEQSEQELRKEPEFSSGKAVADTDQSGGGESSGYVTSMIQKLSRGGDFLQPQHAGGIVQPAKMAGGIVQPAKLAGGIVQPANLLERRANLMLEAISNLVEKFLPVVPPQNHFDLELFTYRVMSSSLPVNSSWATDSTVMLCPAQKFTDRFLIHGEFFPN